MTSKLTELAQQRQSEGLKMSSTLRPTPSRESYKWFLQKIVDLRSPVKLATGIKAEQYRKMNRFIIGNLYYFYYDPKGKDDLDYYDRFPLVLTLQKHTDGFMGLNLHYLPIQYRVAFLGKLMKYAIHDDEDGIKRLRISYDILNASKTFKAFRPCIKRYLNSHIRSKILAVQPNEWDVATFLPVQQFRGAQAKTVWQDSVHEIRNS
jgi:hypothetical protein